MLELPRRPAVPRFYSDLHLLHLAGEYAEKAFRLIDEKTGAKVDVGSACARLDDCLEQLARDTDAAAPAGAPTSGE